MAPVDPGKSRKKPFTKDAIARRAQGRGLHLGHEKRSTKGSPSRKSAQKLPDFAQAIGRRRKSDSPVPEKRMKGSSDVSDIGNKIRLLSGARNSSSIK